MDPKKQAQSTKDQVSETTAEVPTALASISMTMDPVDTWLTTAEIRSTMNGTWRIQKS